MARFSGIVGVVTSMETAPGVYTEVATEYHCSGEIIRDSRSFVNGESVNANISLANRFSIIANPNLISNISFMRYVKWNGQAWVILNAELVRPRIILTVGGVYNGY